MLLARRTLRAAACRRRCSSSNDGGERERKQVTWWALWRSEQGRWWMKVGAGVYALLLGGAYVGLWYRRGLVLEEEAVVSRGQSAKLGGSLQLTDHNGKAFDTEKDLEGKWWVVYFGFTSCPTVCPAELKKITETVTALESDFGEGCITPVFVTLDPARDSPQTMKEFLKPFHPNFVGLTGTEEEVDAAARKFRVYYSVIDTEDQELSPGESPTDYQLDHSCIIYVMSPQGVFSDFFSKETNGGIAVEKVARHLDGTMDYIHKQ